MAGNSNEIEELLSTLRGKEKGYVAETKSLDIAWQAKRAAIFQPKEAMYKQWAEELKIRLEKKDRTLQIVSKDEISTHIARELRAEEVSEGAIAYVREVLPSECKNKAFVREQVNLGSGLVGQTEGEDILADSTNDEDDKPIKLSKSVDKMSHAEALDAIKEIKEYADNHRSKASHANKIVEAIQEHGQKNKWGDVAKAFKPVKTPTPGAHEGVFYSKLIELGNGILDYAEKVKQYPASPEDDIRYGAAVDTYLHELYFVNDLKHTKGERGWMKTIHTSIVGHKHEAAVIHKVVGQVPVVTEDIDTLEKKTEIVQVNRNLTREAVGDNIEPIILASIKKINAEFMWEAVEDHHDTYIEPYIGIRKELKHDDLSEKSIG